MNPISYVLIACDAFNLITFLVAKRLNKVNPTDANHDFYNSFSSACAAPFVLITLLSGTFKKAVESGGTETSYFGLVLFFVIAIIIVIVYLIFLIAASRELPPVSGFRVLFIGIGVLINIASPFLYITIASARLH